RLLVERSRGANQRLERALVELVALVDVDRAAHLTLEARVEELRWIGKRRALRERELDGLLVRLARADDAVVRPHRHVPLPFLNDIGVRFLDELAHAAQRAAAPIAELGDPRADQLRRRLL